VSVLIVNHHGSRYTDLMGTSPSSSPARRVQRLFLGGLLTLLPIWLTWVVIKFVFVLLSDTSRPLVAPLAQSVAALFPQTQEWITAASVQATIALAATLLLILGVGWLAGRVIGQRVLDWVEVKVQRLPGVGMIYSSARKLLDILQTKPDGTQRVVLVEFPHPGMKVVGLVTRMFHDPATGREFAAVYIPTTPNPTSGYLEIVPIEQITPTEWTVDQAMSFIISGGASAPDVITFDPPARDTETASQQKSCG